MAPPIDPSQDAAAWLELLAEVAPGFDSDETRVGLERRVRTGEPLTPEDEDAISSAAARLIGPLPQSTAALLRRAGLWREEPKDIVPRQKVLPEELQSISFEPAWDSPHFPPQAIRLADGEGDEQIIIIERRDKATALRLLKEQNYRDEGDLDEVFARHLHYDSEFEVILARSQIGEILGYHLIGYSDKNHPASAHCIRWHKKNHHDPKKEVKGLSWAMTAFLFQGRRDLWEGKGPHRIVGINIEMRLLRDFRNRTYLGKRSPVPPPDQAESYPGTYPIASIPAIEAEFITTLFDFTDVPCPHPTPSTPASPSRSDARSPTAVESGRDPSAGLPLTQLGASGAGTRAEAAAILAPDAEASPAAVPGDRIAVTNPLLTPRIMQRRPSPLELEVLGDTILCMPKSKEVPPAKEMKKDRAALHALMAEYWIERGEIGEAIKSLHAARSTLPARDVSRRDELMAEWKIKQKKWLGWADRIAEGERAFLEGRSREEGRQWKGASDSFRSAAETLVGVVREVSQETLPVLVHQVMHGEHLLEAALLGARRADFIEGAILRATFSGKKLTRKEALEGPRKVYGPTPLELEVARLHYEAHQQMFWSPVTYDSRPSMVAPVSALFRDAILLMKEFCGYSWTHDNDLNLLMQTEWEGTVISDEKRDEDGLILGRIAHSILECGIALSQLQRAPEEINDARRHYEAANQLMQSHFGGHAPDFVAMLVRETGAYLDRIQRHNVENAAHRPAAAPAADPAGHRRTLSPDEAVRVYGDIIARVAQGLADSPKVEERARGVMRGLQEDPARGTVLHWRIFARLLEHPEVREKLLRRLADGSYEALLELAKAKARKPNQYRGHLILVRIGKGAGTPPRKPGPARHRPEDDPDGTRWPDHMTKAAAQGRPMPTLRPVDRRSGTMIVRESSLNVLHHGTQLITHGPLTQATGRVTVRTNGNRNVDHTSVVAVAEARTDAEKSRDSRKSLVERGRRARYVRRAMRAQVVRGLRATRLARVM